MCLSTVFFVMGWLNRPLLCLGYTIKPVLSGHSKKSKTNVLKIDGSLIKVESITFDLHLAIFLKPNFGLLFERPFKTGLTVVYGEIKTFSVCLTLSWWVDKHYGLMDGLIDNLNYISSLFCWFDKKNMCLIAISLWLDRQRRCFLHNLQTCDR